MQNYKTPTTQVANTRPTGRIGPSTLFYLAQYLVSTRQQRWALAYLLRSSYIYTVPNYIRPFEGNHEADVAPRENEFDTPALEDNIRENLGDLGHSDDFLDTTPKAQFIKEIIDKLDFIKIENFCSTEENVKCPQNEKTSHRMGENIFKRHIW